MPTVLARPLYVTPEETDAPFRPVSTLNGGTGRLRADHLTSRKLAGGRPSARRFSLIGWASSVRYVRASHMLSAVAVAGAATRSSAPSSGCTMVTVRPAT